MSVIALDNFVIKSATIAAASSGNNTVVPAVAGKMIAVLQLALSAEGTVSVKFQSGTGGTNITGLFYLINGADFELSSSKLAWFMTAPGQLLNINLSGNVAVGGVLSYIEV